MVSSTEQDDLSTTALQKAPQAIHCPILKTGLIEKQAQILHVSTLGPEESIGYMSTLGPEETIGYMSTLGA